MLDPDTVMVEMDRDTAKRLRSKFLLLNDEGEELSVALQAALEAEEAKPPDPRTPTKVCWVSEKRLSWRMLYDIRMAGRGVLWDKACVVWASQAGPYNPDPEHCLFACIVWQRGETVGITFICWPEALRGKGELFEANNRWKISSISEPAIDLGRRTVYLPGNGPEQYGHMAQSISAPYPEVLAAMQEFASEHVEKNCRIKTEG